jgi:hypothetical protein
VHCNGGEYNFALKKVAIRIKTECSCSMLAQHVIIIESDKFVPLKNLSFLPGLLPSPLAALRARVREGVTVGMYIIDLGVVFAAMCWLGPR